MTPDILVFDIDAVLIDTARSFSAAVTEAVRIATDSDRFTTNDYWQIKSVAGFNNDWLAGCAGFVWLARYPALSNNDYCQLLAENCGGAAALDKLARPKDKSRFQRVTQLCQESYGGTACKKLYGFEPATIQHEGKWRTEQPLLSAGQFARLTVPALIFTGRDGGETEVALEILGWQTETVLFSDDPALDKPNPRKLIDTFTRNGYRSGYYFGDSIDDYNTVLNFNRASDYEMEFILISNNPSSVQQTFLPVEPSAQNNNSQAGMPDLQIPTFPTITQALTELELL